jgi:hypothetical protein
MQRLLIILFLIFSCALKTEAQTLNIDKAVSKDDHKRKMPLIEALNAGFAGVSIKIKVGKDGALKCNGKNFEDVYLKPLQNRITENNGWVYSGRPDEFYLIVHVDGDSLIAMKGFEKIFENYGSILSSFSEGKRQKKAIKIVLSGDVPRTQMLLATNRFYTFEESIQKIDARFDGNSISISKMNFDKLFNWDGSQSMPNMQYHSFISYLKNARKAGRLTLINDIPDNPNAWGIMLEAGADFLEIENFEAFTVFWRNRKLY